MIDYVKLFSGHSLNIVPEFIKDCAKDSVWHIYSDFIRFNVTQDMIKSGYLLVLDSYTVYCMEEHKEQETFDMYTLHLDILWHALSDDNCAKIELHIRND